MTHVRVGQERNSRIAAERNKKKSKINYEVTIMAKMCTMDSCKTSEGMCIHEKMMAVVVMVVIVAIAAKLLQVF